MIKTLKNFQFEHAKYFSRINPIVPQFPSYVKNLDQRVSRDSLCAYRCHQDCKIIAKSEEYKLHVGCRLFRLFRLLILFYFFPLVLT